MLSCIIKVLIHCLSPYKVGTLVDSRQGNKKKNITKNKELKYSNYLLCLMPHIITHRFTHTVLMIVFFAVELSTQKFGCSTWKKKEKEARKKKRKKERAKESKKERKKKKASKKEKERKKES